MIKILVALGLIVAGALTVDTTAVTPTNAEIFKYQNFATDNDDSCYTFIEHNVKFSGQDQELVKTWDDPEDIAKIREAIATMFLVDINDLYNFNAMLVYKDKSRPGMVFVALFQNGCGRDDDGDGVYGFWETDENWDNLLALAGLLNPPDSGKPAFEPKEIKIYPWK